MDRIAQCRASVSRRQVSRYGAFAIAWPPPSGVSDPVGAEGLTGHDAVGFLRRRARVFRARTHGCASPSLPPIDASQGIQVYFATRVVLAVRPVPAAESATGNRAAS